MKKIYILGNEQDSGLSALDFPFITVDYSYLLDDETVHDFIVEKLQPLDFDTLLIPCEAGQELPFRLGYHIRLTASLNEKTRFPILFISKDPLATILKMAPVYGSILLSRGCDFAPFTSTSIENIAKLLKPITRGEYESGFINRVSIQPPKGNNHSLANQWGALSLGRVINLPLTGVSKDMLDSHKQLYFKYILAKTAQRAKDKEENNYEVTRIKAEGKRILYLDDEANKGWSTILRGLFIVDKPEDFCVVQETVSGWDGLSITSKELISSGNFDLFLIDLRLNGEKEETLTNPKDFSGAKILQKIKELNAGNQVVMFTASNKAWNLKTLIDMGADGYYIKESPEYAFPIEFSVENYNNLANDIRKSLNASYLRPIVNLQHRIENCIEKLFISKSETFQQFYGRTKVNLQIAFELLKKTPEDQKYFNYAYLTYYQIIEDYISQPEIFKRHQSGNYSVNHPYSGEIEVIRKEGDTEIWQLKYLGDSCYIKRQSESDSKKYLYTNAKVAFVLAFSFEKDNNYLRRWGDLNEIRNEKAVHGGKQEYVSIEKLNELLEVVELFLIGSVS